ncbi:3-octaprenyl-4-hydroxybenzoate carboxy-lyase [Halobellus sp. GM3]|uniref:3-octaprenyl-4-hydroxybenzoate carboxy-lyase n=1 Tax=Halobellus sp. GM3 TaxID=3458410 RepID=UPI00403E0874
MSGLRTHLDALEAAGDVVEVGERTHWADTAAAVAGEAARANGPAVLLTETGGAARLAAGVFGGPDRLSVRARDPWSRVGLALGLGGGAGYLDVLDALVAARSGGPDPETAEPAATETVSDLRSLGLPAVGGADGPTVTLALATVPAASPDDADAAASTPPGTDVDAVQWLPACGSVHGSDRLRLTVPAEPVRDFEAGDALSVVLGPPPTALLGATMRWVGESHIAGAPRVASALGPVPVAPTAAGAVPAESEVIAEATVTAASAPPRAGSESTGGSAAGGPSEPWEDAVATATLEARIDSVTAREDPVIPFSPVGAPMADGRVLLSIIESARLYGRVNNYWGVSPVEWLALPAEAGLGICLVASDILYAGFEWQLANTLFSFSRLFDKVFVLDTETAPMDLGRAFDDIWVKAHPANDWEFSDPEAPAAHAPRYRRDGSTGANVYVNAAWDPRWDEEYIAPRVTFETTYPRDIREAVRDRWTALGFEHGPEHEPGGCRGDGGGE